MAKRSLPLSRVYGLLEPGPVTLVSTAHKGRANIMTMSWHMMMEFEPPLVGCIISNGNYSFTALKTTGECVINILTVALARQVVCCGNTSGRNLDKFQALKLTPVASRCVQPLRVEECYANLECKVVDRRMVAKYNLFVLGVLKAWVDPKVKDPKTIHHRGGGRFMVAGKTLTLPSRMK